MPIVKRGDGRDYRMLDRGAWKGFYDAAGRIARRRVRQQRRRPRRLHRALRRQPPDPPDRGGRGPRLVGRPLRVLRRGGHPREGGPLPEAKGPRRRVDLSGPRRAAVAHRVRRRRRRQAGARRGDEGGRPRADRDGHRPRRPPGPLAGLGQGPHRLRGDRHERRRASPTAAWCSGPKARLLRVERVQK